MLDLLIGLGLIVLALLVMFWESERKDRSRGRPPSIGRWKERYRIWRARRESLKRMDRGEPPF